MSGDNLMQQVADEATHDRYDDPPEIVAEIQAIMDDWFTFDAARRWAHGEPPFEPIHPDDQPF